MPTWKKVTFIVVLVSFIFLSLFFTFYSIARDTFEFEEQTAIGGDVNLNGWVFYGFNGNTNTKTVDIDYVRDKKGDNPDCEKPVVAVDDFTIVSDEYVEFINIGKDVQYIDEKAFYYCKQLKAIFVDEDNPYFCSVNGVLFNKDKTTLMLHPVNNAQWLYENGMVDETGYTFKQDNGETVMESYSYAIPEGVTRVNGYSFYKNYRLRNLTFPDSLKEIGDMAFFSCTDMWSIWLNDGLEYIGNDSFSYCWCMSPIMYIPSSVTHIGNNAFFSCSALKTFYMGADSAESIELGESWLPKSIKKGPVNVPPQPQYGKTFVEAQNEKIRIDAENTKEAD